MPDVNWLAVVVGGIVGFFSGGLWYSKAMFCSAWARESGVKMPGEPGATTKHPGPVFLRGIVLSIITSTALAWMLGGRPELAEALKKSAIAGACFVGTSYGINYGFAQKSATLWAIDAGYHLVQFVLIGLVLGLWH